MLHVRLIFLALGLLVGATDLRAQSIAPDCQAVGWLSALRQAHRIQIASQRMARIDAVLGKVDTDAMLRDLTKGMSRYDADVLRRFVTVSRRSPRTLTPRMRRELAAIPMPVHCKGLTHTSAFDGLGSMPNPISGESSSRLEASSSIGVPIMIWWILPLVAGAGILAMARRRERDQRRSKRHPCAMRVTLRAGSQRIPARFADVSQTGGKLKLRIPASDLTSKSLIIELPGEERAATLIWAKDKALGFAFCERLNRAELRQILISSKQQERLGDDRPMDLSA